MSYCLYILDGTTPALTTDVKVWAQWFKKNRPYVAMTKVAAHIDVSTVFRGITYQEDSPLFVFETRVLGGVLHGARTRYCTWHEAEQGHETMVDRVRATLPLRFHPEAQR